MINKIREIFSLLSITNFLVAFMLFVSGYFLFSLPPGAIVDLFSSPLQPKHLCWLLIAIGIIILISGVRSAELQANKHERPIGLFSEQPSDIRKESLSYLRTHRNWYVRSSEVNKFLWNTLTCGIIVLSALSSILSAYGVDSIPKWIPVTTSALSALFGTIITQFRIRDVWQLREQGRIEAEMLVADSHLIDVTDKHSALEGAVALRKKAYELELKQFSQFFMDTARPAS